MGTRGPIPKRTEARLGHQSKSQKDATDKVKAPSIVEQPPADPDWHSIARDWYKSLAESGQARFFEPSDWSAARYVAAVMTRNLVATKFNGQLFSGVWSAMNDLMTTEGARRRLKLEIERPTPDTEKSQNASVLAEYRKNIAA